MTTSPPISPDTLMAFADGELDARERAEIEAAIAADPALAADVERYKRLRRALADAYGPLAAAPAPDHLAALIRRRPLAARPFRIAEPRRLAPAPWAALAASIVLGVLVGSVLFWGTRASPGSVVADAGGLRADGALARALSERLAGDPSTDGVSVGLSFRDDGGSYCRAFAVGAEALSGFACRDDDAWRIRMTVAEAPAAGGEFRPAATALPDTVLRAIEDSIEGDPLDAAAEASARDRGWTD